MPELTFIIDTDYIPLAEPVSGLDRRGTHLLYWSALRDPDHQPPVHVPRARTPRYLSRISCWYDRNGKIDPNSWQVHVDNGVQYTWRIDVIPANVIDAWEEQALYWAYLARVIRRLPRTGRPLAVRQAADWHGTTGEFEMVMTELFPT